MCIVRAPGCAAEAGDGAGEEDAFAAVGIGGRAWSAVIGSGDASESASGFVGGGELASEEG